MTGSGDTFPSCTLIKGTTFCHITLSGGGEGAPLSHDLSPNVFLLLQDHIHHSPFCCS